MIADLIGRIRNKYLKRILKSSDPEKELERIEKKLVKELNGKDRIKYKKE